MYTFQDKTPAELAVLARARGFADAGFRYPPKCPLPLRVAARFYHAAYIEGLSAISNPKMAQAWAR